MLGLPGGAEPDRVDAAHRRLASRAHPDRWLGAEVDEQETVRVRFDEVNEAYGVLKAARKAGLGSSSSPSSPGPRRRVVPVPEPHRPAAPVVVTQTASTGSAATVDEPLPDIEDDPERKVPPGIVVAAGVVGAVLIILAAIGLSSPSADGGRQRAILGPLAHRLWEAERTGDHGTMWDLAEDTFKASVDRDSFVSHLDACPRRRAPRDVARIDSAGGGLWEVESIDTAGRSGLTYFRQEDSYRFGAVLDDPDLRDLLAAPVDAALEQPWCRRR